MGKMGVYIEELFEKYADWKILRYFLENPEEEIHVNGLARKLDVSAGSVSTALKKAHKDDLLLKKVVANAHLYSLNEKNSLVKKLQKVVKELE